MKRSLDVIERRCPRLGGPVTFEYCRSAGEISGICRKILDCWWERFDVAGYLKSVLPREVYDELKTESPSSKVSNLVEMIAQAKARRGNEETDESHREKGGTSRDN